MSNEQWMVCTSCKAVVQLNATGICLGCQGGFNSSDKKDKYKPTKEGEQRTGLKARKRELKDAINERKKSKDNLTKH